MSEKVREAIKKTVEASKQVKPVIDFIKPEEMEKHLSVARKRRESFKKTL